MNVFSLYILRNKATNKQPNKQPNKFSAMSYTKQEFTEWINVNRPGWKQEIENLKKKVNSSKEIVEEGEFILKNIPISKEDEKEIKKNIKQYSYSKKFYSRIIKFNIYCCNNDWENIKIYNTKIQEIMGDILEFYIENYSEGDLLSASEYLKKNYEVSKGIVEDFKLFYE